MEESQLLLSAHQRIFWVWVRILPFLKPSWVSLGASTAISEPQFSSSAKWVQLHLLLRIFEKSNGITDGKLANVHNQLIIIFIVYLIGGCRWAI